MTNLTKILTAATGVASLAVAATFIPTATAGESCGSCSGDKIAGTQTVAYEGDTQDIVATAIGAGQFNTLATALTEAGLVETLQGDGPFTVFAPTDDAFAALPDGTVETLLQEENRGQLTKVLTAHVVPGRLTSSDLLGMAGSGTADLTTVSGDALSVGLRGGAPVVYDESGNVYAISIADVMQSNGVIHVVDGVLLPQ